MRFTEQQVWGLEGGKRRGKAVRVDVPTPLLQRKTSWCQYNFPVLQPPSAWGGGVHTSRWLIGCKLNIILWEENKEKRHIVEHHCYPCRCQNCGLLQFFCLWHPRVCNKSTNPSFSFYCKGSKDGLIRIFYVGVARVAEQLSCLPSHIAKSVVVHSFNW